MKPLLRTASLLFGWNGRIPRSTMFWTSLALGAVLVTIVPIAERISSTWGVVLVDLVALLILASLAVKRLKDRSRSPWALLALAIPVLGPLWLFVELYLRRGTEGVNPYGDDPYDDRADYLTVESAHPNVVEEVTRLYPTRVFAVATPTSIEEVRQAIARTKGSISIGGGRFSMGGQAASPDSLHIDMRKMNRVLALDLEHKTIRVQAGIRWCDIQRVIDPHDLSVKIMQTYANFTVGGSLGVNVHGRYVGLGPLILSVRSIAVVLANGERVDASRDRNAEIFYGAIGGYGALGVIVEAELDLADNTRVEQVRTKVDVADYAEHFRRTVRSTGDAVFHNGDLYPNGFSRVSSVTWVETKKPVTSKDRLRAIPKIYAIESYIAWTLSEMPFGAWRRERIIDPLFYLRSRVHFRNYEAGYDVGELEPPSRAFRTYVLQEYFVPIDRMGEFVPKMAAILERHRVNMLNVSIRHALADDGSLLAWAREECFAFVLYYKQRTRENAKSRVAVWTRELIDAAIACGGSFYLPYQVHATKAQFHAAYPRARELFALKRKLDPDFRFKNAVLDAYHEPAIEAAEEREATEASSEFHAVFGDVEMHDRMYLFLQNVYRLYPEDRFHALLKEATDEHRDDEAIYRYAQQRLAHIKPFLSELTFALPSLAKQKREISRQTLELLGTTKRIEGYVEIGSTGRYISDLRSRLEVAGEIVVVNELAPTRSPADIAERGQLGELGRFVPLADYAPLELAEESFDLITCYIGLHHIEPGRVAPFLASIHRALRRGGTFIVRDHDVTTPRMDAFVSLVHTVFNLGLGASWATDRAELRHFAPAATWAQRIEEVGFSDAGKRLRQPNDPTDNLLMAFAKGAA